MNRDQTIETLRHKLDRWNSDLDDLEARMDRFEDERRKELRETIDDLKEKREEAGKALARLRSASDSAFEDVRRGVEAAWETMSGSVHKAKRRFN